MWLGKQTHIVVDTQAVTLARRPDNFVRVWSAWMTMRSPSHPLLPYILTTPHPLLMCDGDFADLAFTAEPTSAVQQISMETADCSG
jgi:hypothetical protein